MLNFVFFYIFNLHYKKDKIVIDERVGKITLDGKDFEFPIIEGSENEKAIDINKLRATTGYITIDSDSKILFYTKWYYFSEWRKRYTALQGLSNRTASGKV